MPEVEGRSRGRPRSPWRVPEPARSRCSAVPGLLAVALALVLTGCASEVVRPEGEIVAASLRGPTPLSAAVVDLTAVDAIEVPGGEAFTREVEGRLRAVLVLHEPGTLTMRLQPAGPESPGVTLVELADGGGAVVADLEAYRVEIDDR